MSPRSVLLKIDRSTLSFYPEVLDGKNTLNIQSLLVSENIPNNFFGQKSTKIAFKDLSFFRDVARKKWPPRGQQERWLCNDAKFRCQVSGNRITKSLYETP